MVGRGGLGRTSSGFWRLGLGKRFFPAGWGGGRLSPAIPAALARWGKGEALEGFLEEMVAKSWAAPPHPLPVHLCFKLSCSQIPFPSASSLLLRAPLAAWAWRRRQGAGGACGAVGRRWHKDLHEEALLHGSFLVSAYNPAWGCYLHTDFCFWGLGEMGFARGL